MIASYRGLTWEEAQALALSEAQAIAHADAPRTQTLLRRVLADFLRPLSRPRALTAPAG